MPTVTFSPPTLSSVRLAVAHLLLLLGAKLDVVDLLHILDALFDLDVVDLALDYGLRFGSSWR